MDYEMKVADQLPAETALRVVLQRVLFQLAFQIGEGDYASILRQEHKAAMMICLGQTFWERPRPEKMRF